VGAQALSSNSTGELNTATGAGALANNFAGNYNTATGCEAMYFGLGSNNTADGFLALGNSTSSSTASNNTAIGSQALASTTANYNTAIGQGSLYHDTTGSNNVALGSNAGGNLTTGSNNIDIGAAVVGAAGEANTIRIGRQGTQKATFVAGIAGVAVSGRQVVVSSNGKLGIATSSARFKQAIKPMDSASEAILRLKPVSFRYKEEIDPDGMPQFGLIAEEVAKVNPDLVVRDDNGEIYTVRYEAVNAMLLNEFLKEHRTVEELKATAARQEATIAQQQKEIKALTAGLKEQASQIQKVSRQLEVSNTAPQMVANNQ